MVKNQKNKTLKKADSSNSLEEQSPKEESKNKNSLNIEIKKNNEDDEEYDIEIESEENEDENGEDEEDEKKEMREFTIELLIHTKVMDNREEIKKCICHNYIILDEKENDRKIKKKLKDNENIYIEKEIIPSIEIPIIRETNDKLILNQLNNIESSDKFYIKLNDLTKCLLKKGFPLSGSMINIFVTYANNYVYFGTEPLDDKIILYSYMLEPNKDVIKMKIINYIQKRMLDGYTNRIINTYFRKPIKKVLPSLEIKTKIFTPSNTNLDYYAEGSDDQDSSSSLSSISYDNKDESDNLPLNKNNGKQKKLNFKNMSDSQKRERKIGYIIEKVYAWRKLYNGYKDEKNNYIKYSLDKAAEKIDVSKKSLDDYLLQIRLGRKYGFDFDQNKYKKIGILREFVKNVKEKEPWIVKKRKLKQKKNSDNIGNKSKEKNNKTIKKENDNKEPKITNSLFSDLNLDIFNKEKKNKKVKSFLEKKRQKK